MRREPRRRKESWKRVVGGGRNRNRGKSLWLSLQRRDEREYDRRDDGRNDEGEKGGEQSQHIKGEVMRFVEQ